MSEIGKALLPAAKDILDDFNQSIEQLWDDKGNFQLKDELEALGRRIQDLATIADVLGDIVAITAQLIKLDEKLYGGQRSLIVQSILVEIGKLKTLMGFFSDFFSFLANDPDPNAEFKKKFKEYLSNPNRFNKGMIDQIDGKEMSRFDAEKLWKENFTAFPSFDSFVRAFGIQITGLTKEAENVVKKFNEEFDKVLEKGKSAQFVFNYDEYRMRNILEYAKTQMDIVKSKEQEFKLQKDILDLYNRYNQIPKVSPRSFITPTGPTGNRFDPGLDPIGPIEVDMGSFTPDVKDRLRFDPSDQLGNLMPEQISEMVNTIQNLRESIKPREDRKLSPAIMKGSQEANRSINQIPVLNQRNDSKLKVKLKS